MAAVIEDIVQRIDNWLEAHSHRFDPFTWSTSTERKLRRKAFDEAALYLYVSEGSGCSQTPRLRDTVLSLSQTPEYAELVTRSPRDLLLFSFPIIYLRQNHLLSPRLAGAVFQVLSSRAMWAVERLPHRLLDLWHFCTLYGVNCPYTPQPVLSFTNLKFPLDPIESRVEDAYALTHTVFFTRNFGIPHPSFEDARSERFGSMNPYELLLLRFLFEENFDICAELMLSSFLEGVYSPLIASLLLIRLRRELDEKGYIPSPACKEVSEISFASDVDRQWAENYHTMLVTNTALKVLLAAKVALQDALEMNIPEHIEEGALLAGTGLKALAGYELPLGSKCLEYLISSPSANRFQECINSMGGFLQKLLDTDGSIGQLVDERHIFYSRYPNGDFERDVGDPVHTICSAALEKFRRVTAAEQSVTFEARKTGSS